jgi:hypothetical protein
MKWERNIVPKKAQTHENGYWRIKINQYSYNKYKPNIYIYIFVIEVRRLE